MLGCNEIAVRIAAIEAAVREGKETEMHLHGTN